MGLAKNVGWFDRIVRAALGTGAVFYGVLYLAGWSAIIAVFIGLVLLVTAFAGSCPLYSMLGIRTRGRSSPKRIEEMPPMEPEKMPPIEMEEPPMAEEPPTVETKKKPKKKAKKKRRKKKAR